MSAADTIYLANERQDQTPEQALARVAAHGLEAGLLAGTDYYGHEARMALPFALVSDDKETYRLWLVTHLHGSDFDPSDVGYALIYVVSTEIERPAFDDRAPLAIFHATGHGCTHPPILYYEMTFVPSWTSWRFVLGRALERILACIVETESRYYAIQSLMGAENALWSTYSKMGIDAT